MLFLERCVLPHGHCWLYADARCAAVLISCICACTFKIEMNDECGPSMSQVVEGFDLVQKLQYLPIDFFSKPKDHLKIADCGVLA